MKDHSIRDKYIRYQASPMPQAVIGQHIVINVKGKELNGKVKAFNNQNRFLEVTANGKNYLGQRGETFKQI